MKRRKKTGLCADDVFAETSTNEFLVALETWIGRKLPAPSPIPEAQLEETMADLDRLVELAGKPDADPELIFRQLSQAVTPILPAPAEAPPTELPLNRHERLFRAVYFFESETFNDGVESYLTAHHATDVRWAIEGLGEIGAVEMQARLDSLCKGLFDSGYPETEEARSAVVESPTRGQATLLKEFSVFHARNSAKLDVALAAWARANRQHFV